MEFNSPILQKEQDMTKREFTTKLKNEGWVVEKYTSCEKWKCGDISILLKSDETGNPYIQLSDVDWGYIENIEQLSFTPFRILIQWNMYQEWYLKY